MKILLGVPRVSKYTHMTPRLTFRQFVREKFYDSSQLYGDKYLELFIDPTTSELRELSHRHEGEVGAILSYNHLYVFDRDLGMHTSALRILNQTETAPHAMGKNARIPFYIYPSWVRSGEIQVLPAFFSMGQDQYGTVTAKQMDDATFLRTVKAHPAMRSFTDITLR